jgi:hypothetical protein
VKAEEDEEMTVEEVIDVSDIEMLYVQFAANQMGAIIAPARAARCTGAEKYHDAMVLGGSYGRSPWLSHAACMVATLGSSLSERPAQYRVPIRRRAASRSSLMGMSTANRLLPSHVRKTGLLKFSAVKMACTKTLLADQSTATRRMQITPTVQDVTFHSREGDILHTKESKVSHLTL